MPAPFIAGPAGRPEPIDHRDRSFASVRPMTPPAASVADFASEGVLADGARDRGCQRGRRELRNVEDCKQNQLTPCRLHDVLQRVVPGTSRRSAQRQPAVLLGNIGRPTTTLAINVPGALAAESLRAVGRGDQQGRAQGEHAGIIRASA